ncbi:MAG: hypothetical protein H0W72_12635 [Planctomycetes bacterium]|nr:hypothetical protein [Planctomycetota bacterium]
MASYAVLSLLGGYVPSGNVLVWQAKWCVLLRQPARDGRIVLVADGAGAMYTPLILLDRRWLHPDEPVPPPGSAPTKRPSDW